MTMVSDLVELAVADYVANVRKSIESARQLSTFWKNFAGNQLAAHVTGDILKGWARQWQNNERLSNGRVNRRMGFLLRGF